MMSLVPMTAELIPFVHECLRELRGAAEYSVAEMAAYFDDDAFSGKSPFAILVAVEDTVPVGMLTCNRFAIPRYLGFGIEIEEVVVHPEFQNKGVAKRMLEQFLADCRADTALRKVIIKTDDEAHAGHIYRKFFVPSKSTVFAANINNL